MEDMIREALEGSIEKWSKIVDGTGADDGTENCPLCHMFYDNKDMDEDIDEDGFPSNCHGCPVKEKTGRSECEGTPFYRWREVVIGNSAYPYRAVNDESKAAAREELEFLKSLRPTEDK